MVEQTQDKEMPLRDLVEYITKALVDKPEEVSTKEVPGKYSNIIVLRVAKEDLGKIIGKAGQNASALRAILEAASGKLKKRHILEIVE